MDQTFLQWLRNELLTLIQLCWAPILEGQFFNLIIYIVYSLFLSLIIISQHIYIIVWFDDSEEKAKEAIFYHYTKHINGFAAKLEEEEAMEIATKKPIMEISINPDLRRSKWDIVGMSK